MNEVLFTDQATNQFKNLEQKVQHMIISRLKKFRKFPDHYLKQLKGYPYFALRIGDYRAIIDWRKNKNQLWVIAVGHRRNIYGKDL